MQVIALMVRAISGFNRLIGNIASWLSVAIVIVCFTVVVQRYVFATTQLWMQDLYVWLNGAMFTAVAGFALLRNDHVRVDIFYRPAPIKRKALIDLVCVILFLLPYCVVVWLYSYDFVARSWRLQEGSANPGGMPGLFVLKAFILGYAFLVGIQGISMALRSVLVLAGKEHLLPAHLRYEADGSGH